MRSLRRLPLLALVGWFAGACAGPKPVPGPQSVPVQPAPGIVPRGSGPGAQPGPGGDGRAVGSSAAAAVPAASIVVRIEGLGPTLDAAAAQLSPLSRILMQLPVLGAKGNRTSIARQLGMKNGASLDFSRAAGEILGAPGIGTDHDSFAAYAAVTSEAALEKDLAPPTTLDGLKAFPLPKALSRGVLLYESGALVYASDVAFAQQVAPTISAELAKPLGKPGVEIRFAMTAGLEQDIRQALVSVKDAGPAGHAWAGLVNGALDTVQSATFTYHPGGDTLAATLDVTPRPGRSLALPATPAPDGAALPFDAVLDVTASLPPAIVAAVRTWAMAPRDEDAAAKLAALTTGTEQIAVAFEKNGTELVDVTGYTDSAAARALLQTIAATWQPFCGPGGFDATIVSTVTTDLTKINGIPVDRVAETASSAVAFGRTFTVYLACPPGACVTVVAPTEARAKLRLVTALVGLAKDIAPLARRPGPKRTIALLGGLAGGVSHGILYEDMASFLTALLTDTRTPRARHDQPGLGLTWNDTPDGGLRLTAAMPIAPLAHALAHVSRGPRHGHRR